MSRPGGRHGLYASLVGSNPRRLKGRKGDELHRNGRYAKSSVDCF